MPDEPQGGKVFPRFGLAGAAFATVLVIVSLDDDSNREFALQLFCGALPVEVAAVFAPVVYRGLAEGQLLSTLKVMVADLTIFAGLYYFIKSGSPDAAIWFFASAGICYGVLSLILPVARFAITKQRERAARHNPSS